MYLYTFNYPENNEALAMLEMRALFKKDSKAKYLFSDICFNPSYSPYIKIRLEVLEYDNDFTKLLNKIKNANQDLGHYKLFYLKTKIDTLSHEERIKLVRLLSDNINGEGMVSGYENSYGITYLEGKYYFGTYIKNDYKWHEHDNKLFSYSNALSIRMARTLINLACEDNTNLKLIDPCCGIGSVVLEGLSMKKDIIGYDISSKIAANAKANIKDFGYDESIINEMDMHLINNKYDVCILDIPYGLYSKTTQEIQEQLIIKSATIAPRLILVSSELMDDFILSQSLVIKDFALSKKSNFKRYTYIIEH